MCRSRTMRLWDCPILFDRRIPMNVQPANIARQFCPSLNQIEMANANPALFLLGTIAQGEQPLSSCQPRPINGMGSQRIDAAVSHRCTPFGAVRSGVPVLVEGDDVASLVDDRVTLVFFRCPRPQWNTQTNSSRHPGRAVHPVTKPSREPRIEFDQNHLSQLGNIVTFAGESDPLSNLLVIGGRSHGGTTVESGFRSCDCIKEVYFRWLRFHRA